ncbi:hypothetical protein COCNU_08G005290 [Cocos nucifera]|uniref:Uncharacterized protein n=1 Tax=Cocos nucifera TaxID=13894 RepID=A0A8K0N5N7_COCNU|nr:hypothetical protein COCNU_08G005290 [Cocos nucifera]
MVEHLYAATKKHLDIIKDIFKEDDTSPAHCQLFNHGLPVNTPLAALTIASVSWATTSSTMRSPRMADPSATSSFISRAIAWPLLGELVAGIWMGAIGEDPDFSNKAREGYHLMGRRQKDEWKRGKTYGIDQVN